MIIKDRKPVPGYQLVGMGIRSLRIRLHLANQVSWNHRDEVGKKPNSLCTWGFLPRRRRGVFDRLHKSELAGQTGQNQKNCISRNFH